MDSNSGNNSGLADEIKEPGKGAVVIACSPGMTGLQRRYLRGLGHALSPVVHVGQHGLTAELRQQLELQLGAHELIKIRVQEGAPVKPVDVARWIHTQLGAAVPQILGHTLLAYLPHPENPKIRLPSHAKR